jgi:phospholipid/cholesterol/gamma-HCH transport system permease protein
MNLLDKIGRLIIKTAKSLIDTLFFAGKVLFRMFRRRTYNNATRHVLIDQIYFTSVQILPIFLLVSMVLGSLLIGIVFGILKKMGLTDFFGNVLMGLIVTQLCPLFTVLFITLRSASAINAEIAVMKVTGEIRTLETFHIDVIDYLLVPRIINGIISIVLLSSLFSIVLIASGIVFSRVILNMSMDVYANILLNSADFSDMLIALIECVVFGFFITLIPIRSGLGASQDFTSIPVAVSGGMVNVFTAIIVIEVLSLITKLF